MHFLKTNVCTLSAKQTLFQYLIYQKFEAPKELKRQVQFLFSPTPALWANTKALVLHITLAAAGQINIEFTHLWIHLGCRWRRTTGERMNYYLLRAHLWRPFALGCDAISSLCDVKSASLIYFLPITARGWMQPALPVTDIWLIHQALIVNAQLHQM